MSDLDRIVKLASHGTADAQSQAPAERQLKEAPVRLKNQRGFTPGEQEPEMRVKNQRGFTPGAEEPAPNKAIGITSDPWGVSGDPMDSDSQSQSDDEYRDMVKRDDRQTKEFNFRELLDKLYRKQGSNPATELSDSVEEAVGEFADPILDLSDELECDSDHPVLGELIRYLDGDTIKDFVADFRRHNDMNGDMEESLKEDSNKELALKDWYQNWSHHTGGNGDELPKGWFKAELDSGITTDGIEQSELDMNWEEDRLPITDAMKDDFKSIMGNDDEETLRIAYDICRELWEAVDEDISKYVKKIPQFVKTLGSKSTTDKYSKDKNGKMSHTSTTTKHGHHNMDEAQQLNASDYHCSDCGDTMHKPTTDCSNDPHDETGSWWVDKDGNGVPDSLEEAPNEGNEFSGALADAKKNGKKEFEVDGKKYKVESEEAVTEGDVPEYACINTETGAFGYCDKDELHNFTHMMPASEFTYFEPQDNNFEGMDDEMADQEGWTKIAAMESDINRLKKLSGIEKADTDTEELEEAQSPAQKAAFAKMLASKKGAKKDDKADEVEETNKEELEESPTMDTTQLINLMKNSGLSEEKIKTKLDEWANTPAGAAEEEATSHGEPYENFAQSVNLSLKRYLDAEDMKVGLKEHTIEDIKEAYKKSKGE